MSVKLTKKMAYELIGRICPRLNISEDTTPPDAAIFRAYTGRAGLEIKCENDWADYSGRIRLTISDGDNRIVQYYHPDTLNRDYAMEACARQETAAEERREWVQSVGANFAHKMVDQYIDS